MKRIEGRSESQEILKYSSIRTEAGWNHFLYEQLSSVWIIMFFEMKMRGWRNW